jgi:hypothetical protein
MMSKSKSKKLYSLAFVSLALLGALLLPARRATAVDSAVCTINKVIWVNSGTVVFWCDNVIHYAFAPGSPPAGCGVTDLEARKQWYSTAQTSLLSGRKVQFANYLTCAGGLRTVTEMTLTNQ